MTGASSGIGRELALRLARRGVQVAVSARSVDKLQALARECPGVLPIAVDVTDRAAVVRAHDEIRAAFTSIDLAVLNAGVWHPFKAVDYDADKAHASMAVNYGGIVNALEPLVPAMIGDGKGHLALVASVAGYRGLPQAAAYAPSKAAVISLAEVLRLELAGHGIKVQLVNPGFVETPMTAVNDFEMPYILEAGEAAERIIAGLRRDRFEVAFPWQLATGLKLMAALPYGLYFRLASRLLPRR